MNGQTEGKNLVKEIKGQLRERGTTSSLGKFSRMSKIDIIIVSNINHFSMSDIALHALTHLTLLSDFTFQMNKMKH